MLPFHKVVAELRKEAGYASPWAFYNARGGQDFFKCTYRQYFNIEKGITAPKPRIIQKIALGLELLTDRERAEKFAIAYLRFMSGDKRTFDLLVSSLAHPPSNLKEHPSALVHTISKSVQKQRKVLTLAQSKFIRSHCAGYWAWEVLASDLGHWSVEKLSALLGSSESVVQKSLTGLVRFKLISKDKAGKYFCPHAADVHFGHPVQARDDINYKAFIKNYEQMMARKGEMLTERYVTVRASQAAMQQYWSYIHEAQSGAQICATQRRGADTALFLITLRMAKIFSY